MVILAKLLFIAGICLAVIGGAGFAEEMEGLALPLFLGGLAAMFVGGLMQRKLLHAAAAEQAADGLSAEGLAAAIRSIRDQVLALQDEAETLDAPALADRIDLILRGPCFDLGARNEDYIRVLGNATYVRYWDGFAVGERLLARAWSMAADGAIEQARKELPWALGHFQRAAPLGHFQRAAH